MADLTSRRFVLFRLAGLPCAMPASVVREVIPAGLPTRIPGATAAVAGLVNLRGALLTVVDGRRALGAAPPHPEAESVLVVDRGARQFGLAVDEVVDLVEVPAEDLAPGESLPGVDPKLVAGVGRQGGQVFAVLDAAALLAPALD